MENLKFIVISFLLMFYCLIVLSSAAPKAEETKLQISPTKQQQESETSARLLEDELPTAPQNEAGKSTIQQPEETEDTPIAAQQNEDENSPIDKRQLKLHHNKDGSITGSFAMSNAFDTPGMDSSFGVSETFTFGPKGVSFSGGQSSSFEGMSPIGDKFGNSNSNSMSMSSGLDGFSSSGGNAASNHFSNPMFSTSNANANAFANNMQFNNPFSS